MVRVNHARTCTLWIRTCFDVGTSNFAACPKVNSNELSLQNEFKVSRVVNCIEEQIWWKKVRLRSTYVYLSRGNLTTCTTRITWLAAYKSWAVIVSNGLRISIRFQHRVRLNDFLLQWSNLQWDVRRMTSAWRYHCMLIYSINNNWPCRIHNCIYPELIDIR